VLFSGYDSVDFGGRKVGERVGKFLRELRNKQRLSIDAVVVKFHTVLQPELNGRKPLSRQSLWLMETGKLNVPRLRENEIVSAYAVTDTEKTELLQRIQQDAVDATHTEEEKFVAQLEAIISSHSQSSVSVWMIGGKKLPFTSNKLRKLAAEFLTRQRSNELAFVYPARKLVKSADRITDWPRNSLEDVNQVSRDIKSAIATQISSKQLRFFTIFEESCAADPLLAEALMLCNPLMTFTIVHSKMPEGGRIGGVAYIQGDRDSWVMLQSEHAAAIYRTVGHVINCAARNFGASEIKSRKGVEHDHHINKRS
jgi:hypothetical protein